MARSGIRYGGKFPTGVVPASLTLHELVLLNTYRDATGDDRSQNALVQHFLAVGLYTGLKDAVVKAGGTTTDADILIAAETDKMEEERQDDLSATPTQKSQNPAARLAALLAAAKAKPPESPQPTEPTVSPPSTPTLTVTPSPETAQPAKGRKTA